MNLTKLQQDLDTVLKYSWDKEDNPIWTRHFL